LNTIEQGLLNLAATVNDSEMMNEVFRAAHSVKGGAAMLGLNSIQRTSHRMEDFFKIMKESPVRPDRDLETMLLQIFDGLQEQLEQLQSPFGLTNNQAKDIMAPLEPIFVQAEAHLDSLVAAAPAAVPAAIAPRPAVVTAAAHPEISALQLVFRSDVPALLRDMLAIFKQPDSRTSRQELRRLSQRLHSIGEQFELIQWCALAQVVEQAIGNPDQTYRMLAPVVIKDLKQAQDQVLAGASSQVKASATLEALLPLSAVAPDEDSTLDVLLAEALSADSSEVDLANLFAAAEEGSSDDLALTNTDWLDEIDLDADNATETGLESVFGAIATPPPESAVPLTESSRLGPEVGAAELNSLADLFEGASDSLGDLWEDESGEVSLDDLDDTNASGDLDAEFADLLIDDEATNRAENEADQAINDMASLFGYDLDAGPSTAPVAEPASGAPTSVEESSTALADDPFSDFLAETAEPASVSSVETDDVKADKADVSDDPLANFLDDEPLLPTTAATTKVSQNNDDLFEVGGEADVAATNAVDDDVSSFFDAVADDDFIDDDDAHTMPELNLELDPGSDTTSSDHSSDHNGLFTDTAPQLSANSLERGWANADVDSLFGESDAEDELFDDPFGEFRLSTPEISLNNPFGEEPELAPAAQTDSDFDVPVEADGIDVDSFLDEVTGSGSADDEEDSSAELENLLGDDSDEVIPLGDLGNYGMEESEEFLDLDDLDPADEGGSDVSLSDAIDSDAIEIADSQGFANDNFDELDALLGETQDYGIVTSEQQGTSASEPEPDASAHPFDSGDDEFDDLEKLLEEADQLGGSTPMGGRRSASVQTTRRLPRRTAGSTDQTMRVSVNHLDTLSNLVGELVVNRNSLEQDQERLRQFLDNLLNQVSQLNDVGQRMRDLYERSLLESSLIANRQAFALGGSSDRGGSSHATGATFDALEMDRFTGFHTLSQEMIELIVRVREASSDIEFTIDSTDQIARQFRQVTTQLQEGLNKARMVPFGQTAERLPRAVRDISLQCGKEAQLVVEGRDTLIDKMILERLYDPMTHLVNNAITHGIELPEERLASGKDQEGTITVRAFYQGNQTVIYIADNGGGINPAVVKAKALKQGLITRAEVKTMTEVEVYDLLFLPGFSTRDQADDFSGRGVGMDVVRTALADIRGSITIESEVGKGTSFTIRLPLTLSITKALSCVNNQARIAFPMDGVEDMFDVPKERI
ncbi:MAG: ATP-binding protein, partial [Nodosilinea sp.]